MNTSNTLQEMEEDKCAQGGCHSYSTEDDSIGPVAMKSMPPPKKNIVFAITIVSVVLGALIRIVYCIQYSVQPRDAFTYGKVIAQWEETGVFEDKTITFIPFSLWILKIPHHFFNCDIKGGIIINTILALFIIILAINIAKRYTKNAPALLIVGVIVATHPSLVRFSCTCLRENTYIVFCLLVFDLMFQYLHHTTYFPMLFSGASCAFAFLCRLEGIELLAITSLFLILLRTLNKICWSKFFLHFFLLYICFFTTVMTILYFLNLKLITLKDIVIRLRSFS